MSNIIEFKSEKVAIEYLLAELPKRGATSLLANIKPNKEGKREWDPMETAHILANMSNRKWRMNNLYKVRNKDGEIVKFVMNSIQQYFDDNKWHRNIIVKSRQVGFTTYKAIDQFDRALFNGNQNCILVAHREGAASEIFKTKIEFAWNNLHPFVKSLVSIKSKTTMSIEFDRSKSKEDLSTISTDTSARSGTYSSAHVSELAYLDKYFPERAAELMAGLIPAVPPTGQLDIESTARGNVGLFYDRFHQAVDDPKSPKQFKPFFFPWMMDDYEMSKVTDEQIRYVTEGEGEDWHVFKEYQRKHKLTDKEIAFYYFAWDAMGQDWEKLREEYPTTVDEAFAASEKRVFPAENLRGKEKKPNRTSGGWSFFEDPIQGHRYVIGADPSEGIGKDAAGAVIINIETNDIAATYSNKYIEPDLFGMELATMGKFYNGAYLSVEKNAAGYATISKMREVYDLNRIHKETTKEKQWDNKTNRFGWRTSGHNKQKMVYDFRSAVIADAVGLKCANLIGELLLYSRDEVKNVNNKVTVKLGSERNEDGHFDLCDSAFIAWQTKDDALKYLPRNKSTNKRTEMLKLKKRLANIN